MNNMKHKITINNREVTYTFKQYRQSKSIKVSMHKNSELKISAPTCVNQKKALDFLLEQKDWIERHLNNIENNPDRLNAPSYHSHKFRAKRFIMNKVNEINRIYQYEFKSIRIKDNSRSWGSCSVNKILNFNYRLMFIPEDLAEYVVAHELCHLQEMNHSPDFWKLVEVVIPDYKEKRRGLKKIVF